ncbi:hypothetical protein RHSIM_Rhsim03G0054300 [Rhododendron simsii]|uniref:Disease resistance protein At4g27190-like leucine-rich repeats domain-containing protein n=1 Tax=Rhododendron simsii TaxID=118357 RepID=A0A834H9P3_RHOSS|nr:hypothetical protein RHSIM_Rhsim03G0054300 [Rhododendron simsii]
MVIVGLLIVVYQHRRLRRPSSSLIVIVVDLVDYQRHRLRRLRLRRRRRPPSTIIGEHIFRVGVIAPCLCGYEVQSVGLKGNRLAGFDFQLVGLKWILIVGIDSINLTSAMASTVVQRKEAIVKLLSDESSKYNEAAVRESIARQLSLFPLADEWDGGDDVKEAEKVQNNESMQEMIAKSVARKKLLLILDYRGKNKMDVEQKTLKLESPPIEEEIASGLEDLILDDEGMKMNEEQIISNLETILNLNNQSSYKVIITRVKVSTVPRKPKELNGWSLSLRKSHCPYCKKGLGAEFMMFQPSSYFDQHGSVGVLKRALEEASTTECYNLNRLLCNGYHLVLRGSIIIDCCRRQSHFFLGHGESIYYNDSIAYWILEGYLGHVDCLEKAYEKGHSVFIELVDCQVLRKLEGGFLTVGSGTNCLEDLDRYGFGGRASLGLADLFTVNDLDEFGRLTYIDGMVKSICKGLKGLKLSTLFLNKSRCWEILDCFYRSKQELKEELQVLALFNPTFESLPQLLNDLHKLVVLVLRGAINFKEFHELSPGLPTGLLSETRLQDLPSSINPHHLFLKRCSELQKLTCTETLKNLEIRGFELFPKGIEDVLSIVDCIFFVNNTFVKCLSDIGVSSRKAMTGCWIAGCTEMEGVFGTGKEDDSAELGTKLQFLVVSNAINLRMTHGGRAFQNLTCLYLDCCPKLSTVFSTSQLSENLGVLHVRFCEKLVSIFGIEEKSPEPELRNLEKLYLWELPEVKSIECGLPSLQTLNTMGVPETARNCRNCWTIYKICRKLADLVHFKCC